MCCDKRNNSFVCSLRRCFESFDAVRPVVRLHRTGCRHDLERMTSLESSIYEHFRAEDSER